MKKKNANLPLILIVLDGWGLSSQKEGNSIYLAKTPFIDSLYKNYPNTKLKAHGKFVGLPSDQVGNSEAGHMNIGAGRIIEQDSVRINASIKDKSFFENESFEKAINNVKKNNSNLHLIGLLSDKSSPHSETKHLESLLKLARDAKVKNTYLHIFTDGRDSFRYQALKLITKLEKKLKKNEKIATVMGRFYAMDRKKKWERTEMAYDFLVSDQGKKENNIQNAIIENYNLGHTDEFIKPFINKKISRESRINHKDSVIFFNLRSDRARQLTKPFVQKNFNKLNPDSFKRIKILKNIVFVAMTNFGPSLGSVLTAFPEDPIKDTLPKALGNLKQLYIAESEKYAHVTYFLNGGYDKKINNEDYFIIKSPMVRSYDKTPGMKSKNLTNKVIKESSDYDFIFLNLAAPDMIGHTGNLKAGIKCCEIIDECLMKIVNHYLKIDGTIIVTADHGNVEKLFDVESGRIDTKHTKNPVPLIIINKRLDNLGLKNNGKLSNISPTVLNLLGIKKPKLMREDNLIKK